MFVQLENKIKILYKITLTTKKSREMKNKKLIVFNLRGTLILSYDQVIGLWCEAIKDVGLSPDFNIIFQNWDKPFRDFILPLLAEKGAWVNGKKIPWTEEQKTAVIKKGEEFFHDLHFNSLANLPKKILELKDAGYELGIITNRSTEFFEDFMADIELKADIFSFIKTGDDDIKKPDPRVFNGALEKFEAKDIVFVGDSPETDLVAAISNDIDFIAIESAPFPKGLFKSKGIHESLIFTSVIKFINAMISAKKL